MGKEGDLCSPILLNESCKSHCSPPEGGRLRPLLLYSFLQPSGASLWHCSPCCSRSWTTWMNIKNMPSSPGCSSRVWPLYKSENLLCGSPCQGSVRTRLPALAAASGCPVLCLCLLPSNTVLGLLPFESFLPPWILHMTQRESDGQIVLCLRDSHC